MSGGPLSSCRVAVLGAGLSGLRAAHEVAQAGAAVSVFESRAELGGRARGEWQGGHWMDAAWPVLGGRDQSLARWAAQLGLHDAMWPLRPVQSTLLGSTGAEPIDASTLRGAARIPGLSWREKGKLLRWSRLARRYASQLDPAHPERAKDLDFRSLRDHVQLYFGSGALDAWLTPEIQTSHGDSVEELSRVAMLLHCAQNGIGERRPGQSGLPRRPLLELLETSAELLDVRLATAVERVDEEPAGGFRVELRSGLGERSQDVFDAVIVTLGAAESTRVCASMLTPAERDFFAAVETRTVVTLSAALEGLHGGLPQEIRLPRRAGSAIASLLIEPGQIDGRVPEGESQLVVLARDEMAARWSEISDDVVAKNLLGFVDRALPGLSARVKTTFLDRAEDVPFFGVGSYRRMAGFQRVQLDRRSLGRRLYWAGGSLSGPTHEARSLSGERAAAALVEDAARDLR